MSDVTVRHGDALHVLTELPDASVDSVVTDPPYEIGFMAKSWDNAGIAFDPDLWRQALRVLKPGGHLLAFGATRTYHRMAVAIEDAGFEIRDSIHWIYGTGFPKSLDVAKAIDKAAGAEREVVGPHPYAHLNKYRTQVNTYGQATRNVDLTAPATDDARTWDGWGTALKPSHEPIVLARKPLEGTVAANVLAHGTGALNIDGARVGTAGGTRGTVFPHAPTVNAFGPNLNGNKKPEPTGKGRWPTNLVFTHDAACTPTGTRTVASNKPVTWKRTADEADLTPTSWQLGPAGAGDVRTAYGDPDGTETVDAFDCVPGCPVAAVDDQSGLGEKGGASRFFNRADYTVDDQPFLYVPKPARKERNAGLDGMPERVKPFTDANDYTDDGYREGSVKDRFTTRPAANNHPTVKPVALMRHLVRLVTPPGGTVLDPFAGSGTTLVAAVLEGVNVIGVELTEEYLPIIAGRVSWAREQHADTVDKERAPKADDGQPALFPADGLVDNLEADTGGTDG